MESSSDVFVSVSAVSPTSRPCRRRRRRKNTIPAPIMAAAATMPMTMPAIAPPCKPDEFELSYDEDDESADVVAVVIVFHPFIATAATVIGTL